MPVRNVVTRSPHRRTGSVSCPWFQQTPIEYESLLERDFIRLALLDLRFRSIEHQPFIVDLNELGEYTPDFLLLGENQKLVVEVKPAERAESDRNAPRLSRAKTVLRSAGYDFILATENDIRGGGRDRRAAILLRHARSHLGRDVVNAVTKCAEQFPSGVTIGALASSAQVPQTTVLHLIGRRALRINQALNFSDSELVFPIGGGNGDLHA